MTDNRIIPTPAPADLPTFQIIVDGEQISSEYSVASITVVKSVNKIPTASLTLFDGDASQEDFEVSNSDVFVPGNEIAILAGYHSDETTIFKGIITGHGIKIRKNKPGVLHIECRDKAAKMAISRQSAYYTDQSDSDIFTALASASGIEIEAEPTDLQHPDMVKYYTTDWDFMIARAEANGKLVVVDDGKITIAAPDTSQAPVLSLLYGSTMLEFEADMDARPQLASVISKSWDYANQEIVKQEGQNGSFQEHGNIGSDGLSEVLGIESFEMKHAGRLADEELKAWADAKVLKNHLAKITGRVKCQGFAEIKPGKVIELSGVGERFNGNAFVTAVRHTITSKNWETDAQFGHSPRWFYEREDIIDEPASGLLPGVNGLQIGIVTQIGEDPDGEDRVLVRMPLVDPDSEGIWVRVASLDAGENRGFFFRPEIDDEVILGFVNDDPRDPVLLGMLHSSAKPAPFESSDDNHEKGLVTRSEMKLVFNDDEVSLTFETPNGNKIVVSDNESAIQLHDENGNKIKMTSDGITIESAGDVNIKAGGDVNIEGSNVALKANSQFKAEGNSGVEMRSSATAVIKGSLVQIN